MEKPKFWNSIRKTMPLAPLLSLHLGGWPFNLRVGVVWEGGGVEY